MIQEKIMLNENQITAYLERIGCADARAVSKENLYRLQKGHLAAVPYTNLTIYQTKQEPPLCTEALFEKIVLKRMGGYCFELNGLFAELLRSLGYEVAEYFARWHFGESDPVPMRRHRVLKVTCPDGVFVVDAGVGCLCTTTPLDFEFNTPQQRNVRRYRLIRDAQLGIVVQTETAEGFVNYFSFTEDPHFPQDFNYVNYYCSREPSSPFRSKFMMHRLTDEFQYSIEAPVPPEKHRTFCIRKSCDNTCERTPIPDQTVLQKILAENFGIVCLMDDLPE